MSESEIYKPDVVNAIFSYLTTSYIFSRNKSRNKMCFEMTKSTLSIDKGMAILFALIQ